MCWFYVCSIVYFCLYILYQILCCEHGNHLKTITRSLFPQTWHLQLTTHAGGKNTRGIRVSSYDPDDPTSQQACGGTGTSGGSSGGGGVNADGSSQQTKTLGNQRKFMPGSQRVATISQHYNEKTMLLSSDDEYQ